MSRGKRIRIVAGGTSYLLTRLRDEEYQAFHQQSLCLEEDLGFQTRLWLHLQAGGEGISFGEWYATLKSLTGESGRLFDTWKGSFVFPFLLKLGDNRRPPPCCEFTIIGIACISVFAG